MKQEPPPSSVVVLKALGTLSGLGFTFAIPPVLGAILGRYLDGYLNTGPWITLILLGLGLVGGVAGGIAVLKTVVQNGR